MLVITKPKPLKRDFVYPDPLVQSLIERFGFQNPWARRGDFAPVHAFKKTKPVVNVIAANPPENKDQLFAALHELGHIQDKKFYTRNTLEREFEAWGYVFKCIQKKHHKAVYELASLALATYAMCKPKVAMTYIKRYVKATYNK